MDRILIVGSGASGIHFALSALRKGRHVTMLDVGRKRSEIYNVAGSYSDLKVNLSDPAGYFLGEKYEAVVFPGAQEDYYTKYYGFPPSKGHVFSQPHPFTYEASGMVPLISFAQGGLAEAWTGGAYPLNDAELGEFPFEYRDIEPHYDEVSKRIGIIGVKDDLTRFYPCHEHLMNPLNLDEHSACLVEQYEKNKDSLNHRLKCYLGRSRITTLSEDRGDRKACTYSGRCLWGCPEESLYTPSITLADCLKYPNFEYVPGMFVSHFDYDYSGRIRILVAESLDDGQIHEFTGDVLVLAAGTLSTSKIFLESIFRKTGETIRLRGLMDNRQILIPFVNLHMIGKRYDPETYQYHQLAIGLETAEPEEYIHGQITTLKSALVHPIIQNLPFDLQTGTIVFRNLRASLGIVNLNLYDRRRNENYVTLNVDRSSGRTKLIINYSPRSDEQKFLTSAVRRVKKLLRKMGCIVPPGMVHIRPMGASVHYTGTLPMSMNGGRFTVSENCRSSEFKNLYIVDGSTMPFLPAKNITFTLMANAVRVAENEF